MKLCATSGCEKPVQGRRMFCDSCNAAGVKAKRCADPIASKMTTPKWVSDFLKKQQKGDK